MNMIVNSCGLKSVKRTHGKKRAGIWNESINRAAVRVSGQLCDVRHICILFILIVKRMLTSNSATELPSEARFRSFVQSVSPLRIPETDFNHNV